MFEFRGITARVSSALENSANAENRDVLNQPGKSAVPIEQTPVKKKNAFSDLKNTQAFGSETPSTGSSSGKAPGGKPQFSGSLLSSVLQAKSTFCTPDAQPRRCARTDIAALVKPHAPLISLDDGSIPLQPVDFLTIHANRWLLNDEQIARIVSMQDTPHEPEVYDVFVPDPSDDLLQSSTGDACTDDWNLDRSLPPLPDDDDILPMIEVSAYDAELLQHLAITTKHF